MPMRFKQFVARDTACLRVNRLFKSNSLRIAALFALLFLALTGVLIGTVLWMVENAQESALARGNDVDIATVTNGFLDEGVMEAMEVVRQRLSLSKYSPVGTADIFMLLEDERDERLIGNLAAMPRRLGTFTVQTQSGRISGQGVEIASGLYLFVGRDTVSVKATRDGIVFAFVWVALGASVLAIVAGQWGERIALRGRGDEWDRLAAAINDMLNRIAMLLENLRQVSSDVAHELRTHLTRMRNRGF